MHLEIDDQDMYPEAVALRDLGFEAASITEHVLNTYICFCFTDKPNGDTGSTDLFVVEGSSPGEKRYKITVSIAAQAVWTLLVPEYTASEKVVASTIVASLLLHELAVRSPRSDIPPSTLLTQ